MLHCGSIFYQFRNSNMCIYSELRSNVHTLCDGRPEMQHGQKLEGNNKKSEDVNVSLY